MSGFPEMGGYGPYVWGAYGISAIVIAVELLILRIRARAALAEARETSPDSLTAATGGVL
jgi:heme exporter protein CcmD